MNVLLQKSRKYFFPRSLISIYYDIILRTIVFFYVLSIPSLSLNIYEVHTKIVYYEVYIIRMILFFKLSLKRSLKLMPFFFF